MNPLNIIISLIPMLHWFRFRNVAIDRDYAPYAYCGAFRVGYLQDGHVDIKPPIIHTLYKLWLRFLPVKPWALRLLPAIGMVGALLALGTVINPLPLLAIALLVISPFAWGHMANTEWLTALLGALAIALPGYWKLIPLFLMPFVNQKNVLAVLFGLVMIGDAKAWMLAGIPAGVGATWLFISPNAYNWVFVKPAQFGKVRNFKTHVAWALLVGFALECAPFVASIPISKLPLLALTIAFIFAFKQVMPHHFILLAAVIGYLSEPTVSTFIAWAIATTAALGWLAWLKPNEIYAITFGTPKANYGFMLADMKECERWILANTKQDEIIWVNGMENQVYLNTMRKAWRINIPELTDSPEGIAPRVIVHCQQSAVKFDYAGYSPVVISSRGLYTVMVKQ